LCVCNVLLFLPHKCEELGNSLVLYTNIDQTLVNSLHRL